MTENDMIELNEAQKEAIRQANAYLNNAGLETYSDVTGIQAPDEEMTVEEEARFDAEDRAFSRAERRMCFGY